MGRKEARVRSDGQRHTGEQTQVKRLEQSEGVGQSGDTTKQA